MCLLCLQSVNHCPSRKSAYKIPNILYDPSYVDKYIQQKRGKEY